MNSNDSVEIQLAALRPAPASVAQANFYFRAGCASRDRSVRQWRLASAAVLLALVLGAGYAFWRVNELEQRLAEVGATKPANPPAEVKSPAPAVVEPEVANDEPSMPYSPPMVPAATDDEPTADELADSLELRRKILTLGVTYFDVHKKK